VLKSTAGGTCCNQLGKLATGQCNDKNGNGYKKSILERQSLSKVKLGRVSAICKKTVSTNCGAT